MKFMLGSLLALVTLAACSPLIGYNIAYTARLVDLNGAPLAFGNAEVCLGAQLYMKNATTRDVSECQIATADGNGEINGRFVGQESQSFEVTYYKLEISNYAEVSQQVVPKVVVSMGKNATLVASANLGIIKLNSDSKINGDIQDTLRKATLASSVTTRNIIIMNFASQHVSELSPVDVKIPPGFRKDVASVNKLRVA